MAFMTWTAAEFGTGVAIADEQHQKIFDMVNRMHDASAAGDRGAIGKVLDELVSYVVMHFQTEEKLMQEKKYPDYSAHKAEHDKLVATCADLQKKFHAGQADVTQETAAFVKDWLVNHIPKIDRAYASCLNA